MTPPGGGPENPFFGVPGDPPHPPREGGRGGTPPSPPCGGRPPGGGPGPPPGGVPPPPEGGETPAKKDPPLGYPKFMHKFMTQIRVKKLREGKRVIDFLHTLPYLVSVDYYVENYTYHSDVFSSSSFIFLSSEISD